ncbi:DMT family transporter [Planktomarina sp.]|nr:DMT family transporter [Planktomarina sp.]
MRNSKTPYGKAAPWMVGAIFSFISMAIAGRAVSDQLDTFEIMLYRSLIGFLIVISTARVANTHHEINFQNFSIHFIRNIFHFMGQNLWFFALPLIPLAQLFALEFTSPIWVVLLAPIFLKEKLTFRKICVAALGFIGVLVVARPEIGSLSIGIIAAATAAIGFAASAMITRKLTETDSLTKILFFLTSLQIIFGLICSGYDGKITIPSPDNLSWLVLIGLAGLSAHFCLTKSLTLAPASVVMPFDFVRLPLIAIIGMVFYGEDLDIFMVTGALMILVANYINLNHRK